MAARTKLLGVAVDAPVAPGLRDIVSLAGMWNLRVDPDDEGQAAGWASQPLVPETAIAVPSAVQGLDLLADRYRPRNGLRNSYKGTVWFEREFGLRGADASRRVCVKFGGIAPAGHVWLNGQYVGYHKHGPVSVRWDVTDLAHAGRNRLTVAAVEQHAGLMGGMRFAGMEWSGLYRAVEVETASSVRVEEVFARFDLRRRRLLVSGLICNDGPDPVSVKPQGELSPLPRGKAIAGASGRRLPVRAGGSETFCLTMDVSGARLWSPDEPVLHLLRVRLAAEGKDVDEAVVRIGLRSFRAVGAGLELNGRPFLARGAGQEYFSPTISPLVDRRILRDRICLLKRYGFNFYRCHTHPPTPEELDAADEIGMLYVSEISLVSNFGRTEPFKQGLEVLRAHVAQTRNHPSLGAYCLGNEGSQLMVKDGEQRSRAAEGYAAIKECAPDHAGMIAFGMQGELPELPNDVETPHLWSDYFTWAYDGLSRVPWAALAPLLKRRPCILHEYGKFGVWPDPAEEALYPPGGFRLPFGTWGRQALAGAGIAELMDRVLANSRRLQEVCFRTIIEAARRQEGVDGYTIWTSFRIADRGGGLADDLGRRPNGDPDAWRGGCNAPLAVLIDRDFAGRVFAAGQRQEIGLFLSNFGDADVSDVRLRWSLSAAGCDQPVAEGTIHNIACALGRNGRVARAVFSAPQWSEPAKLVFRAELLAGRRATARNAWDFWLVPPSRADLGENVVVDFADEEFARRFQAVVPRAARAMDVDSMVRGCRMWTGMDLRESFGRFPPDVVVADRWCAACDAQIGRGGTVLVLDSGRLPEPWHPAPVTNDGPFDVNRSFTGFRSGWSPGNIATIVDDHAAMGRFPHEGWCDLQFYDMVQHARPVRTQHVAPPEELAGRNVIIRSVPRMRPPRRIDPSVQDPNAIRELKQAAERGIATDDRAYLMEARAGRGRLLVCTLRLLDDPAGQFLLGELLGYARASRPASRRKRK